MGIDIVDTVDTVDNDGRPSTILAEVTGQQSRPSILIA
jgi:hypothetical protein